MPSLPQLKKSSWLQKELERLQSGNKAEKQRFQNAITAMAKVIANPLNADFNKELPENYKAVDVLQQYRLFFKIIRHEFIADNVVIYFAWMNDEESLTPTERNPSLFFTTIQLLKR